jgi:hypothetical protein
MKKLPMKIVLLAIICQFSFSIPPNDFTQNGDTIPLDITLISDSCNNGNDYGDIPRCATFVELPEMYEGAKASISGSIGEAGDYDYFRIVGDGESHISIYTTGLTDTFGAILNSRGTVLQHNDDISVNNRNFSISPDFTLVVGETYYIGIRHYDPTKTGNYQLVFSRGVW